MDNQAAVILTQMEETRSSMTDKFDAIEEKITSAVSDTAETVTQTAAAVTATVESVKDAVEGTVHTMTGAAEDAVESVKEALDLRRQVADHPWLMLGGAVAVGYAGGWLLDRALPSASSALAASAAGLRSQPISYSEVASGSVPSAPPTSSLSGPPGWLSEVETSLGPVVQRVKGLAIGTTLGLLGQMILPSVPEAFRGQLSEVVDQLTTSLGGEKIEGLFKQEQQHA